jgi:hypothetical protein
MKTLISKLKSKLTPRPHGVSPVSEFQSYNEEFESWWYHHTHNKNNLINIDPKEIAFKAWCRGNLKAKLDILGDNYFKRMTETNNE